jgi:hypothetical protein
MSETPDPMLPLWAENPLPWQAGDTWPDREGELVVMNAGGDQVIYIGNMEDCTAPDIDLMYLIAAAPDLLVGAEELVEWTDKWAKQHIISIQMITALDNLRAAIEKAKNQ